MTFAIMMKILDQKVKRQRNEEKFELKNGIQTHYHTEWDSIP